MEVLAETLTGVFQKQSHGVGAALWVEHLTTSRIRSEKLDQFSLVSKINLEKADLRAQFCLGPVLSSEVSRHNFQVTLRPY